MTSPSRELVPVQPVAGQAGGPHAGADAKPTIEQAFQWYKTVKLVGCKKGTIKHYRRDINRLSKFLGRQATLDDICDETIGAVMQWMLDSGLAPATANKFLTVWKAFGDFLARKQLAQSIEIRRLAEVERTPRAWRLDDVERMISCCDNPEHMKNGIQEGPFMRAILLVAYCTGERIGAILKARWEDLDGNTLLIHGENRKGGRADMLHKLSGEAQAAVEVIRQPERVYIFDLPFSEQTLTNRLDKLCERAGLTVEPRNKWHKFRKTCATYVDVAGGDATRVLGHSTPGLARKTYIDQRISKPPAAADLLPDVAGGNTGPIPSPTNGIVRDDATAPAQQQQPESPANGHSNESELCSWL